MQMSMADKLALLRIQSGFSKEDLSLRLEIPENVITDWETGAATPDIAVLPQLARAFGISVDDLLSKDAVVRPNVKPMQAEVQTQVNSQPVQPNFQQAQPNFQQTQPNFQQAQPNFQQAQPNFQQAQPNFQQAQPNFQQAQPNFQQAQPNFQQQANYQQNAQKTKKASFLHAAAEKADRFASSARQPATARLMFIFPFPLLIVAVYVFCGTVLHLWHPTWIMFLLIPCYYMIAAACRTVTKKGFLFLMPVPIVVVMLFLMTGFGLHIWHPTWILFLLIPLYYWFVAFFIKSGKRG